MATSEEEPFWMEEVKKKLVQIFHDKNPDDLPRVFFYLDEEDRVYKPQVPPVWKTLKCTLNSDKVFTKYAQRLIEDTKRAEVDVEFRKRMNLLYSEMMDASDEAPLPEDYAQGFDMVRLADFNVSTKSALIGLARAWSLIPKISQIEILEFIPKIVMDKQISTAIDEVVGLVNKSGGTVVMVALAGIQLSASVINNFKRFWNGEISGKRCSKNILDEFITIGAGIAGGVGGAALGSLAGPWGAVAGGMLGGFLSSSAMNVLSDRLTQYIFGIPKEEALENAYNFLGVNMAASNHEINKAFRNLCLRHHPDKPGGKQEDFLILQLHMGAIKASRGEL